MGKEFSALAFLLGSGVSIPAGLPSTIDITNEVVRGVGWGRHTDGRYYKNFVDNASRYTSYPNMCRDFLELIKLLLKKYISEGEEIFRNYEYYLYLISQIHDSESGEYDNPAVYPLIKEVADNAKKLHDESGLEILELSSEVENFVKDIIDWMIVKNYKNLSYLDNLFGFTNRTPQMRTDIFSLNHDSVTEAYLKNRGIDYSDGFGNDENGVRYWCPSTFRDPSTRVCLLKLHGATDWVLLRTPGGAERVGIPLNGDIWHTRDHEGRLQDPLNGRPLFLAGTFNKIVEYATGIFWDIHCEFHRRLMDAERLVVCGYGFGDKAINTRLIQWLDSSGSKKIVLIHPNSETCRTSARPAISRSWPNYVKADKLHIIKSRVEDVRWDQIEDAL